MIDKIEKIKNQGHPVNPDNQGSDNNPDNQGSDNYQVSDR